MHGSWQDIPRRGGLTTVVLRNAFRAYVLADSSKHGHVAPFKVCDLGAFAGVITDAMHSVELAEALHRTGVDVPSDTDE